MRGIFYLGNMPLTSSLKAYTYIYITNYLNTKP